MLSAEQKFKYYVFDVLDCFQRIIIERGKNAVNRQLKYGSMQDCMSLNI